jgi:thiol-disulfide isomerase/thioredoxin
MLPTFIALRRALAISLAIGLFSSFAQADSVLRDMRGNITTFDAQQTPGQWTVVMIWASYCPVCNQESEQYSAFHARHAGTKHAGHDAKIVGMSIDGWGGKDDARAFIKRNRVIFPSLIGDMDTVARWYQMQTGEPFRATPTFMVFGPDGELRATQPGAVPPSIIEKFMASNS